MGLTMFSPFTTNTIAGTIQQSFLGGGLPNPIYSSPLTGFFTGNPSTFLPMNSFEGNYTQISPFSGAPTILSSLGFLGPNMMFDPGTLNMTANASPGFSLTPGMIAFLQRYANPTPTPQAPRPTPTPTPQIAQPATTPVRPARRMASQMRQSTPAQPQPRRTPSTPPANPVQAAIDAANRARRQAIQSIPGFENNPVLQSLL